MKAILCGAVSLAAQVAVYVLYHLGQRFYCGRTSWSDVLQFGAESAAIAAAIWAVETCDGRSRRKKVVSV